MNKAMNILVVAAYMIGVLGLAIALTLGGWHNALIGVMALYIGHVITNNNEPSESESATDRNLLV